MESIKIDGRPTMDYKIVESGIVITTFINSKLPTEEILPFEDIKNAKLYYVDKHPILLILAGILLLLFVFLLIDHSQSETILPSINYYTWPALISLLTVSYFVLRPRRYYLKTFTGRFLKFKIKNNELEVSQFVETVINRRNEHIKFKYGTPNSRLSYDAQFSNFNIMLTEQIISSAEYQEKVELLNKLFNQAKPMHRFGTYSQN